MSIQQQLQGKKLLLLATSVSTCDMVRYAQSQGVHVIVADNLPPEKSAAKQIADEHWLISTADLDTLELMAKKHNVNGVFAGVSEFNLEKALTLCERLGLPFYCNREQWNIATNKAKFKELCNKHKIPCPQEYVISKDFNREDLERIRFPVIVKPSDSSGWKGVSVCYNEKELIDSYIKALSYSTNNRVIVEEHVQGDEFTVTYTLKQGEISLSCMYDKYFLNDLAKLPVALCNVFPSKHLELYIEQVNNTVISFLKNENYVDGTLFLQGKAYNGNFVFFEMGYRLAGSASYKFISTLNEINHLEMLINHSLTGEMQGYDLDMDNPRFQKLCCNLSVYSDIGLIKDIRGLDELKNIPQVIDYLQWHKKGDRIDSNFTLSRAIVRPLFMANTKKELIDCMQRLLNSIEVINEYGKDITLRPKNILRLFQDL